MAIADLKQEAFLAAKAAGGNSLTQSSIASALGISQSQVSRVLSGNVRRRSKVFDAVCKYVYSSTADSSIDVLGHHPELMEAVADVWDGTTDHAQALAVVIRSLGALRSRDQQARSKVKKAG